MTDELTALEASVTRLRELVEGLDASQHRMQAYPTQWTIADVLSHLGSGAVIMRRFVDTAAGGEPAPDGFNQSVWDEWNAKAPAAQVADALAADRALLDRISSLTEEQRAGFQMSLGPMTLDLAGFLRMRLSEHALHTWDVEVALDPSATIPTSAAALVLQNVPMLAGFAGKPDGITRDLRVRTSDPVRDLTITTDLESVAVTPSTPSTLEPAATPDLELPAEALIRLVYGRLDPTHTAPNIEGPLVASLRPLFPGV